MFVKDGKSWNDRLRVEDVEIVAKSIEIKKEKDADGKDVFIVSRKHSGNAGTFNVAGSTGGVYSSWERAVESLQDLNLPSRLLSGMKKQLDTADFATLNITETPGL